MTEQSANSPDAARRLRLWPGLLIVPCIWACLKLPGLMIPGDTFQFYFVVFGPLVLCLLFLIWWVFFSRARWIDRGMGVLVAVLIGIGAFFTYDKSVRVFGIILYSIPLVITVWVGWLFLSSRLSPGVRKAGFVVVLLLAWLFPAVLRMDGLDGSYAAHFSYRWEPSKDDLFLLETANRNAPAAIGPEASAVALRVGDWPAFRGSNRDSQLTGVHIATDWKEHEPKLLWKQRVGQGWSSFAVLGDHLYTQEQRGNDEAVICYDANTGKEIWVHKDPERFDEPTGGPGPRATPTFHEGKLFSLGANGRLNGLDAASGKVLWTRNIVTDANCEEKKQPIPNWGFSASPLVAKGLVTVFAGGPEKKAVIAYKEATGDIAWTAGEGGVSYSSAQIWRVGGVEVLLMISDKGVDALKPESGEIVWHYPWDNEKGLPRAAQPQLVGDGDLLIGTVDGGLRRIHVARDSEAWKTTDVWTTKAIKPYFSDFVIHKDHIYGFDGIFFNCVTLTDGKLKWKVRGYGSGQVLLLPDQDLLLILSEKGEGALVDAKPDAHHEICKLPMIKGKTWNHPVIAHGKLFVRNDEEAACYQLNDENASPKADAKK